MNISLIKLQPKKKKIEKRILNCVGTDSVRVRNQHKSKSQAL